MILVKNNLNDKELGGKAQSLAEMSDFGYKIPEWFVVPSKIFITWLKKDLENINKPDKFKFTKKQEEEILSAISENKLYAVRSSARAEDGSNNSFAGQFETYLGIQKDAILEHIKKVFISGLSERVRQYSEDKDIEIYNLIPSVIVQELINADKAGVAFSVNPVSGSLKETVISAVFGLGNVLVDGSVNADKLVISNVTGQITATLAKKDYKENYVHKQLRKIFLDEESEKEVLSREEAYLIYNMVNDIALKKHYPQDIEWAIKDGEFYLLQARPITTLSKIENKIDEITVWDNSNIVESYSGVVSPMTFSFISYAYGEVYKQMCKMFNVPKHILEHNNYTFSHMLGQIKGRVYYNLISWYKLLTMLPGYNFNKDFMIQMMGAKEPISNTAMEQIEKSRYNSNKAEDIWNMIIGYVSLGINYFRIKSLTKRFYKNTENAIGKEYKDGTIDSMSLSELSAYYRKIEKKLIRKWDAPVINDFFAMIFYGLLRKCSESWCNGELKTIYNDLLCGDGQIISTQPAKLINDIACDIVKTDANLPEILCSAEQSVIEKKLREHPQIQNKIKSYIDKFGNRCLEELKLETITLEDNPISFYKTIGYTAKKILNGASKTIDEEYLRYKAELAYNEILADKKIKKFLYTFIVNKARYFVRNRENLRFERTKIFGVVRKIINQIGERLFILKIINNPRDIFYLELNEVLGFIEGTATTANLKDLIKLRKAEHAENLKYNLPTRFTTYGSVNNNNSYKEEFVPKMFLNKDSYLIGTGCCPGIVRGFAKIITNPKDATLKDGEILVAERTDPGWIMLFPMSSAVIVEKGSLLSHAAIVVREMGIPAVIGVEGLLSWLHDGDYIELNGSTGEIRKIGVNENEK